MNIPALIAFILGFLLAGIDVVTGPAPHPKLNSAALACVAIGLAFTVHTCGIFQ